MIEFVTLLLGLVAGPQSVEVAVGEEVTMVRFFLEGQEVASDDAAPWRAELDLGTSLRPRVLEAVAFDAAGSELGRAVQRLNLPLPPAEVRIMLEEGGDGVARAALLTWESSIRSYPLRVRASLDGVALDTSDPRRIPLPAYDKDSFHLLQVELEFSLDVVAQTQAVLGGLYLDEYRAELTAFPVLVRGKAKKAKPADMTGWFEGGGAAAQASGVRVVAFEKGGLDLVVVRAPGVGEAIQLLEGRNVQGLSSPMGASGASMGATEGSGSLGVAAAPLANRSAASSAERLQRIMALEAGQRLRLMATRARAQKGHSVAMEVFALSPEITPERGGLYWALGQTTELPGLSPSVRLADAVAVAALQAANGRRRRAVLLVLSEPVRDESRHSASAVRAYLKSIHVPLHVWHLGEGAADAWREWGRGELVTDFRSLQTAARRLKDELDRQRIAWLEGFHLPTAIRVTEKARVEAVY